MLFEKLYFVCDHQYLSILLLPERKINGGRKTTEKTQGTLDFYNLGPHGIYYTYPLSDWLDGLHGVFHGLSQPSNRIF